MTGVGTTRVPQVAIAVGGAVLVACIVRVHLLLLTGGTWYNGLWLVNWGMPVAGGMVLIGVFANTNRKVSASALFVVLFLYASCREPCFADERLTKTPALRTVHLNYGSHGLSDAANVTNWLEVLVLQTMDGTEQVVATSAMTVKFHPLAFFALAAVCALLSWLGVSVGALAKRLVCQAGDGSGRNNQQSA